MIKWPSKRLKTDLDFCRQPPHIFELKLDSSKIENQFDGLTKAVGKLYRKSVEDRLDSMRRSQIASFRKSQQEEYLRKKEEVGVKLEMQRSDLRNRVVKDRLKVIARSVNWRLKVRKIEDESLKQFAAKQRNGLWMWKLPTEPYHRRSKTLHGASGSKII